jgi:hypothetical protein
MSSNPSIGEVSAGDVGIVVLLVEDDDFDIGDGSIDLDGLNLQNR